MNPWDVPVIQKRIVETCKILGKPVVIATQMLERYFHNHKSHYINDNTILSSLSLSPPNLTV